MVREIDTEYRKYKSLTNMSCSDMRSWKENPLSRKASIGRAAINRNVKLQCKPKSELNYNDLRDLKKANSYLARATQIPRSKTELGSGYTRNEIALKNWAFDIKKK